MHENKNMDDLLMSYLLNELKESELQQVEAWISASSENQKQLEDTILVWEASLQANTYNFNKNKAWNNVSNQITIKPMWQQNWFRSAAAILFLVGMFTTIMNISSTVEPSILYSETKVIIDTLTDGSIITLNKNSSLSYTEDFNSKTREVALKGEAFFDIERDTTKPFIINLESSSVKVLGTSFNIKSNPEDELVRVYVKSGVVLFEYLSDQTDSTYLSITLRKGDRVSYNKVTRKLEKNENDSTNNLDMYWMNQELIFDGIELGKVTQILETVYEVEIKFSDEQSKKCLLTVSFKNAQIEEIMQVIATTFELELEQSNTKYVLKGLSCEEI